MCDFGNILLRTALRKAFRLLVIDINSDGSDLAIVEHWNIWVPFEGFLYTGRCYFIAITGLMLG